MDAVQFGPWEDLGYRRPPVTASFEALRCQGLPEVLFVSIDLPEGVIIGDVNAFAAMIEEAYQPPTALLLSEPDEHGSQLYRAVGRHGIGQWTVVAPKRSGWRITLARERDGQRQVTVEAWTKDFRHWYSRQPSRDEIGPTLATFVISTRPDGRAPAKDPAELGFIGYRRPPATVSYDDLSGRGLPRALFVNTHLPEGVAAYDLTMFAELIKEAYHGGSLRFVRQDQHGSDQCVGLGATGIWEWQVVRPSKPIDGERYTSVQQSICRILLAPEKDGKRVCTVDLNGYPGHEPEDDSPIIFTIRTRTASMTVLAREAATRDPADVAEAVEMSLTWLANTNPAAAGLLRVLAFLPDVPVPLRNLLFTGQPAASLPEPEAAAMIGPALNNPYSEALRAMHHESLVSHAGGRQVQLHPLARAAIRAQLTADESAHWQQAGAALVEAALPADPQDPATWLTYQRLLPLARATLNPAGEGMARIARYLAASGRNEPPDVTPQSRRRPR
jgi:hypothetical protein